METTKKKPKKQKKSDYTKFNKYIIDILLQIHPDTSLKSETLNELNNIIKFLVHRFAQITNLLLENSSKITVGSIAVMHATNLILNGELIEHAISQGSRALTNLNYEIKNPRETEQAIRESNSRRAGLKLSGERIKKLFKKKLLNKTRISIGAVIFITAIVEYICAEILELSGNAAREYKRKRISPNHLKLAIKSDKELSILFKDFIFTGKMVKDLSYFPSSLLPPKKKSPSKKKTSSSEKKTSPSKKKKSLTKKKSTKK